MIRGEPAMLPSQTSLEGAAQEPPLDTFFFADTPPQSHTSARARAWSPAPSRTYPTRLSPSPSTEASGNAPFGISLDLHLQLGEHSSHSLLRSRLVAVMRTFRQPFHVHPTLGFCTAAHTCASGEYQQRRPQRSIVKAI